MVELDGPEGGEGGDKWPEAEKVGRKFEGLTRAKTCGAPDAPMLSIQ